MNEIASEDILQIFATEQDLSFSDNPKSKNDYSDNAVLKIFTKGSNSLPPSPEIAEFLIVHKKLNISGISFKANSVLFEISNDSQLKNWLVKLFEERHENMKLSAESRLDILRICKGKINLLISNHLVFLVVIPNSSAINFPCQNNLLPYGLCNNNLANVAASYLRDEPSSIIMNFLKVRDDANRSELKMIYGVRLESNEDPDLYNLRFLLNRPNITDRLLCTLKDIYGPVSFLSDTYHIIPAILKTGIDKHLALGRECSFAWNCLIMNDILLNEVNEMTIIDKASKYPNRPTNDTLRPSTSTGNPANRIRFTHACRNAYSQNICAMWKLKTEKKPLKDATANSKNRFPESYTL